MLECNFVLVGCCISCFFLWISDLLFACNFIRIHISFLTDISVCNYMVCRSLNPVNVRMTYCLLNFFIILVMNLYVFWTLIVIVNLDAVYDGTGEKEVQAMRDQTQKLVDDGLEIKLLSVLEDLLSSTYPENMVCRFLTMNV